MNASSDGRGGDVPAAVDLEGPFAVSSGRRAVEFCAPARTLLGGGMVGRLPDEVARLGGKRPLLVTDAWLSAQPRFADLQSRLAHRGLAVQVFDRVQPDPTTQNVADGVDALRAHGADLVVAIGGGSSIDCAKAMAVLARNPVPIESLTGYHKVARRGLPLVAVPTTAGTGSEATKVTVITDVARDVKMMMLDGHFTPSTAIVDYELTLSMPPSLTAHVGLDTLTHGIEAYVSRKASALTDPVALSCVALCTRHLSRAVTDPNDREARAGMAVAAHQGGLAFANSSVCLVHGMSRPIGAVFHVPHGLSNAMLLETVTRFSLPGAPDRYGDVARAMRLCDPGIPDEEACGFLLSKLAALTRELSVPRLRECIGLEAAGFEAVLEKMATDALASGSPSNNPVVPTVFQIVDLYRGAF